jgi:hypothetical protein
MGRVRRTGSRCKPGPQSSSRRSRRHLPRCQSRCGSAAPGAAATLTERVVLPTPPEGAQKPTVCRRQPPRPTIWATSAKRGDVAVGGAVSAGVAHRRGEHGRQAGQAFGGKGHGQMAHRPGPLHRHRPVPDGGYQGRGEDGLFLVVVQPLNHLGAVSGDDGREQDDVGLLLHRVGVDQGALAGHARDLPGGAGCRAVARPSGAAGRTRPQVEGQEHTQRLI